MTVKRDYLYAQNQGKLASVCLQRFSSIFETSISLIIVCQLTEANIQGSMHCTYFVFDAHSTYAFGNPSPNDASILVRLRP